MWTEGGMKTVSPPIGRVAVGDRGLALYAWHLSLLYRPRYIRREQIRSLVARRSQVGTRIVEMYIEEGARPWRMIPAPPAHFVAFVEDLQRRGYPVSVDGSISGGLWTRALATISYPVKVLRHRPGKPGLCQRSEGGSRLGNAQQPE
jgi:hypothetical protein